MSESLVIADPMERFKTFIGAYLHSPDDGEFEIRLAKIGPDSDTLVDGLAIRIDGVDHGFTLAEAAEVANIAEETLRAFPKDAECLENLIFALRYGCNVAKEPTP